MIGVILCGGKSRRMGRDKGLIELNGLTFLETVYEELKKVIDEIVVSVNESQLELYKSRYPKLKFILDQNKYKGPLNGIMSVNDLFPKEDLLIIPCDMIQIESSLIKGVARSKSAVYKNKRVQPFPGLYSADTLAQIGNKKLEQFSMQYVIEKFDIDLIETEKEDPFFNANYQEDIKQGKKNA